jgi:RNA polymerase sigma-70 factor (sigma-E family)
MSAEFDEFVTHHGPELLRLAYMLSGSREQAEDLVQNALVKTYRSWDTVRSADRPIAYVRTIVVREHVSWWRRLSNHEVPGVIPDNVVGDSPDAEITETDAMWRLLATLPRRQRTVLALRYYEDLPDADIAQLLGCSPGTVRSNASRGLATLARSAEEWEVVGDE